MGDVVVERATVYRVGRRRYFTRKCAYWYAARKKLWDATCAKCEERIESLNDSYDPSTGYCPPQLPCQKREDFVRCGFNGEQLSADAFKELIDETAGKMFEQDFGAAIAGEGTGHD